MVGDLDMYFQQMGDLKKRVMTTGLNLLFSAYVFSYVNNFLWMVYFVSLYSHETKIAAESYFTTEI